MKYLKTVATILWKVWFYILTALCTLTIGIIIYLMSYQNNNKLTYFFMRMWGCVIFYGSGFTYSLYSKVNLDPNENYIFIANHTSLIDVVLMYVLHPKHPIVFVGKKELEKYPVFGRIYKKVSILVDRSNNQSKQAVFPAVKKELTQNNRNVVIFPEGGVPKRKIILEKFKDGAFISSVYCNSPIVVYVFHNLKNMFPFVFNLGYPGKVKVERIKILFPEGKTKQDLKEEAYHLIYERIKDDKINHANIR